MSKELQVMTYQTEQEFLEDVLMEDVYDNEEYILDILEKDNQDFSYFLDKNLNTLVEDLEYQGISNTDILKMNRQLYGMGIDIYKVVEEDYYILGIGCK